MQVHERRLGGQLRNRVLEPESRLGWDDLGVLLVAQAVAAAAVDLARGDIEEAGVVPQGVVGEKIGVGHHARDDPAAVFENAGRANRRGEMDDRVELAGTPVNVFLDRTEVEAESGGIAELSEQPLVPDRIRGEVVDHVNFDVRPREQELEYVSADEAEAAGDEDP
jgi:hypothetical protein